MERDTIESTRSRRRGRCIVKVIKVTARAPAHNIVRLIYADKRLESPWRGLRNPACILRIRAMDFEDESDSMLLTQNGLVSLESWLLSSMSLLLSGEAVTRYPARANCKRDSCASVLTEIRSTIGKFLKDYYGMDGWMDGPLAMPSPCSKSCNIYAVDFRC